MRRFAFVLPALGLAFSPMAWAQLAPTSKPSSDPAIETVIVTAPRYHFGVTPNAIAHTFITSVTAPAPLLDAIARWQTPICPETLGLDPKFGEFVTQRVREIAKQAGTKVGDTACDANIWITFTHQAQALVDAALKVKPFLLGYHGYQHAIMSHPIQAWYGTATVDIRGTAIEDRDSNGVDFIYTSGRGGRIPAMRSDDIPDTNHAGSLLRDGNSARIITAYIVVDSDKVLDIQLSSIADYVAMLALSKTEAFESCEVLPSIVNLLTTDCDVSNKVNIISRTDLAYLRGVYHAEQGVSLGMQQSSIADEMTKAIGDH